MKKYKIKPYHSYYHYKQRKLTAKRLFITIVIFAVISIVVANREKINLLENLKILYSRHEEEAMNQEPVYFKQNETLYNVHHKKEKVKAVYLPASYMSRLDEVIKVANETEINAVVVDIKDDYGYLTFDTDNPKLQGMLRKKPPIQDIGELMDTLYKNNIYPIARIVTFKDSVVEKSYPERMVRRKDGTIFTTPKNEKWLNPYDKNNWNYILEVCREAINLGFKEIQFDYIRFHESMKDETCDFPPDKTRTQVITEFVEYMYEHLHKEGVVVSADVFGTIITSKIDAEIVGQDYKALIKRLDYICPMIYPSHYGPGSFGISNPDLDPYGVILRALQYSNSIYKEIPRAERRAEVRPWLQDFTATWVKPHQSYGPKQVREQINATYDALVDEWILWNAAGKYSVGGLEKE